MSLRIQCPSCDRQFKVSEDLKGRTVECGACEHRFKLDDEVVVQKRDKFYPGEQAKKGLGRYGSAPSAADASAPVKFQVADYNQTSDVANVTPMSPQEWFSTMMGGCILVSSILIGIWGAEPGGLLQDMEVLRRAVLAGFMVFVAVFLIAYGCGHRRKKGLMLGLPLATAAISLALFMPVHRTLPEDGNYDPEKEKKEAVVDPTELRKSNDKVKELIRFATVERAIAAHKDDPGDPADYVSVIWVPVMEERYKFQILRYLQRKTASHDRPGFYPRGDGAIFVIDGPKITIAEVVKLAQRFGRVVEVYHDIRVVEVAFEDERMGNTSETTLTELTNIQHPAFYDRNRRELKHIDLERVKGAVRRLSTVEPTRFRVEISRLMLGLLDEEDDAELREVICKALQTWAGEDGEADAVVAMVARRMQKREERIPRSMMEFLVQRKSPEAVAILEPLWVAKPIDWEPLMVGIGLAAEDAMLRHLNGDERGLQQSAIRILKRIGTERCLGPLKALGDNVDDETKLLLKEVIESIESNP